MPFGQKKRNRTRIDSKRILPEKVALYRFQLVDYKQKLFSDMSRLFELQLIPPMIRIEWIAALEDRISVGNRQERPLLTSIFRDRGTCDERTRSQTLSGKGLLLLHIEHPPS